MLGGLVSLFNRSPVLHFPFSFFISNSSTRLPGAHFNLFLAAVFLFVV